MLTSSATNAAVAPGSRASGQSGALLFWAGPFLDGFWRGLPKRPKRGPAGERNAGPCSFLASMTGAVFQPELIELMKSVLEEATALLPEPKRTSTVKANIASEILKCAAKGERDPMR